MLAVLHSSVPTRLRRLFFPAAALLLALAGCLPTAAAERTLWQIGEFDYSSIEFHAPVGPVVFEAGVSDPASDWPPRQPGTATPSTGEQSSADAVVFDLAEPPAGLYRLIVSVLLRRSRIPRLQVEINGRRGIFYFRRKISYYPGDSGVDSPIYGGDRLTIQLPTSALRQGRNKLILRALDDPADGPGDSWITYDALRLEQDPQGRPATGAVARIEPTIFYVRREGGLAELADVTVTATEPVRAGSVELTVAGRVFKSELTPGGAFGEQRLQFAIPEFRQPLEATLAVRFNGDTHVSRVKIEPKRQWTMYVVPNAHLDLGFTDYRAKVAEIHCRNLDKLLDEIDVHPEMRFSLDGSWIVREYLATRNAVARERLLQRLREGKITVPAQLASLMTGYPNLEELIRSTDYTRRLHAREGVPFDYANITDVPSYTWSYASVLSALGVRYFSAATNSDRGPVLLYGRWNEKAPFWWQGPDGSRVLMSWSRQYFQLSFVCGVPAQMAACRQSLPAFLQQYESPDYVPDDVLMYGSQIENTDLIPGEPEFVRGWNAEYAFPRMVLSTFPDYMRHIEERYGSKLATITGDGGPYWEDGYATDAHFLAIDRANQQRALSAEKLSTIASRLHPNLASPAARIRAMWNDLVLYAEHTFTSWGGYSRPESGQSQRQFATKDRFPVDGRELINAIVTQSLSQLAARIDVRPRALVVFNLLNWKRNGFIETDLDAGHAILAYPGRTPVPVEVLAHHDSYDRVRFFARDVPSFGYRVYQVVSDQASPAAVTTQPISNTIENRYYRVTVDPDAGAVRSIFDKELGRELVDPLSPYGFNQYLYVAGGDGRTQIVYMRKALPTAKLTVGPAQGGRIASVRQVASGPSLTYTTSGPHAPSIESRITLFDDEKKIEFVNRIQKEPVNRKEAVYFAFPVAAVSPKFAYEIQNGWVDPARDTIRGSNPSWFTVQHWVKVSGAQSSVGLVPVDAPLVTLGDINRGTWPERFAPASGSIFSYALNNYWHTNFRRVQSGKFTFRYLLTSGSDLRPEQLSRLGRAAMTPLESGELLSNDKFGRPDGPLPVTPTSFLEVDNPAVVVVNWKAADDGEGVILRLLETAGSRTTAELRFPLFELENAGLTTAAENDLRPLTTHGHSVSVDLTPHQIVTVRVALRMR